MVVEAVERLISERLTFFCEVVGLRHAGGNFTQCAFEYAPHAPLVLIYGPAVASQWFAVPVICPPQNDPHAERADAACDQETGQKKTAVFAVALADLAGLGRKKPEVIFFVLFCIVNVGEASGNELPDDHRPFVEVAGLPGSGKAVALREFGKDLFHDDVVLKGYPFTDVGRDRLLPPNHIALFLNGGVLKDHVSFPVVSHGTSPQ